MKQYRSTTPKSDGTIIRFIARDISDLCRSFVEWHKPVEENVDDWVNISQIEGEVAHQGYTFGQSVTIDVSGTKRLTHCYL